MITATRPTPAWWLAAMLLSAAGLGLLPADAGLSAAMRPWSEIPLVAELVRLLRVFGHGEVLVLVAVALGAAGRRRAAAGLITGLVIMGVAVWALKLGIDRTRPTGGHYSFPSGDAATAAVLVPVLARAWGGAALAIAITLAVAFGRVVQGYHFPSDVLVGAGVGIAAGAAGLRLAATGWWRARVWLIAATLLYAVAGVAVAVAAGLPRVAPKTEVVQLFLVSFAPALGAWVLLPWLRPLARRASRPAAWVVASAVLVAGAWLATRSTLWDVDEPRNAGAAVAMVASGDYVVPTFNGEPRLHKPPLAYWMMAVPLRLGLPADWACRLPAVVAAAASIVLLALLTRLAAPGLPAAAGWAALCLAGVPLLWVVGTAATTDGVLLVGILAAQCGVVAALRAGPGWGLALFTGSAIAWGVLAKGPLGVLVPLATVLVAAVLLRRGGVLGWRHLGWLFAALAAAALLFLLWGWPANRATDGGFLRVGVGTHVVQRGVTPFEGHGGRFLLWLPYYIPVLTVALLPWTALVPAALAAVLRGDHGRTVRAVLLAWLVPTFVIISIYATKLPHYGLALVPALALAVGLLLASEPAPQDRRWLRIGWWMSVPLLIAMGLAALVVPWCVRGLPLHLAAGLLGAACCFLLLAWSLHRPLRAGSPRRAAMAAIVGAVALAATIGLALPAIDAAKVAPRLAAKVNACVPAGIPAYKSGFDEPSLAFYLDRGQLRGAGSPEELAGWAAEPGAAVLVVTADHLARAGALPLRELARASGWNPNKGREVELIALARGF